MRIARLVLLLAMTLTVAAQAQNGLPGTPLIPPHALKVNAVLFGHSWIYLMEVSAVGLPQHSQLAYFHRGLSRPHRMYEEHGRTTDSADQIYSNNVVLVAMWTAGGPGQETV